MKNVLVLMIIIPILVACHANEPVIVKKEHTSDATVSEPELIEEETKDDQDQFIEFSLPYEQVVINLKMIPILNEYLRFIEDKKKAIEKMNLIPIHLDENTIYLLEFSCHNGLCSYLMLDQSKVNQTFLVADLAKYIYTSVSPERNVLIIKFNRTSSLPLSNAHLVAIDLNQWEILTLTNHSDHKILNFQWPITSISWLDEENISVEIPSMTELTETNIHKWKESGSQTTDIIFQIDK